MPSGRCLVLTGSRHLTIAVGTILILMGARRLAIAVGMMLISLIISGEPFIIALELLVMLPFTGMISFKAWLACFGVGGIHRHASTVGPLSGGE
jgi:hypothetical protein